MEKEFAISQEQPESLEQQKAKYENIQPIDM
jgi:hypothetical protein